MKKKVFVVLMCLAIMSGMLFANGEAESEAGDAKVVHFKFASNKQDALLTENLHELADLMVEKSNGTLQPELFLEGQLGASDEDLCTGLSEGNFEMLCSCEMLQIWASPKWMGLVQMPFCFRDQQHFADFWKSDIGTEINQKVLDQFGVYTYVGTLAFRGPRLLTANKAIYSVDDMKGLKMRCPNVNTIVGSWESTGANITPVSWGELYSALQSGVVNAQENPAANIDVAAMYQVQDYLMMTNHCLSCFHILMDDKWFNGLTDDQKKAITDATDEIFTKYNNESPANETALFEKFKEKGMTIIPAEEIDIDSFKDTIVSTVLEKFKDDLPENGWDRIQAID